MAYVFTNPDARTVYEAADCPDLEMIGRAIWQEDPAQIEELWRKAQLGDVDAAITIRVRAPSPLRPILLDYALKHKFPSPVLQGFIEGVWGQDLEWWRFRHGLGAASLMVDAFRQGQFDTSDLPDYVEIWRGIQLDPTRGADPQAYLAQGMSWTLCRELAHWFASRSDGPMPIVGRCRLHRSRGLAHLTNRDEDEIVIDPEDLAHVAIELEDYDQAIANEWELKAKSLLDEITAMRQLR